MGITAPFDSDVLLVLSIAAVIYSEGGDKTLLMGLVLLLILMMK